jgi:hypothetical protein
MATAAAMISESSERSQRLQPGEEQPLEFSKISPVDV